MASRVYRLNPHRAYTRKSPDHGVGLEALCAAVVLSAVRDVHEAGKWKWEAIEFLRSPSCEEILDFLELPSTDVLFAQLQKGLSREVIVDLGTDPNKQGRRNRIKANPALQPALFV